MKRTFQQLLFFGLMVFLITSGRVSLLLIGSGLFLVTAAYLFGERGTGEKLQALWGIWTSFWAVFAGQTGWTWVFFFGFILQSFLLVKEAWRFSRLHSEVVKRQISVLMMIIWGICSPVSYAKDLGVHGSTFAIAEQNLLQVIQTRLKVLEERGDLLKHQQHLSKKASHKVRHPVAVTGLQKAETSRQWLHDPSFTVDQDIKDHKGRVIAVKGTRINPLDTLSWGVPLLLLDGEDGEQVNWAKAQEKDAKWVLVKGVPLDLEEEEQRPVYFDQAGLICKRFNIQQIPCRISQKDKHLLVEEISLSQAPQDHQQQAATDHDRQEQGEHEHFLSLKQHQPKPSNSKSREAVSGERTQP